MSSPRPVVVLGVAGALGVALTTGAQAAERKVKPGLIKRPPAAASAAGGTAAGPPASNAPAAAAAALTPAQQSAVVSAHNTLRAAVGAAPLAWSADVARTAEAHALKLVGTCQLAHSGGPNGENLALWTGGSQEPTRGVALWADEKPKYTGNGGPYQGPADGAGHYTQVVWGATTNLGCGLARCANGTLIEVCQYTPRGNVMGQNVY